ncbi:Sulfoquinovosyl transferase SQD2 [Camellia lanceoleosa]|uniref:Sulfoquinovosyl transferase SQD2 n=1 Tax=Camellia lanceoleosa TaxID=1840588 RepID=A0ACC0GAJ1_9ERIC|nr:Sulfoquinovosyl transferase SQD2 [Camellia lanceoleosa]
MPAVFTKMLRGDELFQAYASGDVFMMPSELETLGVVVLEAMSSRLPVVASRAGGLIDIIPEDQGVKLDFALTPVTLMIVHQKQTTAGTTVLHCVAVGSSDSSGEAVKLLVDASVDVNSVEANGDTSRDLIARGFTSSSWKTPLENVGVNSVTPFGP